ncbi:MAG: permease-like cell division protein FtsX [Patescibacteria group bacterium]
MLTIISRIVHYGFKNFWRNGWLSTTTVIIMVLALSVSVGLILFNVVTKEAAASIQDKIDISVYFKEDTSEDDILNVKQALENLAEVKQVAYISRDQALEILKENHKDDEAIIQAAEQLNENPLKPSLTIKAHAANQYANIAQYLSSPNLSAFIDDVSYTKNQLVIERLASIINSVNRGGLALSILMAIVAGLVVFNTIRLAIYSDRDEIGIMRVVGASNSMVRGPYVVEGIIAGVLAALFSIFIATPITFIASPYFKVFVPGFNLFQYFFNNFFILLGYQLLFGVLIGSLSSFIAVRRYLRN